MRAGRLRLVTVIAILGWGVMALGAVRPWGYVPLLAAMAVYSAASFLTREESSGIGRGLVVSFVVLCAAVALQLIPLPGNLREVVSPGLQLAGMPASPHGRPLSIDQRWDGMASAPSPLPSSDWARSWRRSASPR
jgi:hypothetical protein